MRRRSLLDRRISDWEGRRVGTVIDTYPFDGGGEAEMAVVRLPRLGERRMVPVAALHALGTGLCTPYSWSQVEDSPALDEGRHAVEAPERAQSYWSWVEPEGRLPAPWLRSSGSSATARPSRTTPSRTPSAS